ncbi:hypothetical protein [Petroclostridium sp. X23]|uniref:hypothetical protein n=1 Tax=Petroclostridium sp. X23 TaxID=3045146 RepID=UPI0024AD755B|nr:hypothetical protein [Petroclostridium sp. X23]WHH60203.1 hypothetical protein QKW49_05580 [Petroclostridium sp. X23]
MSNNQKKELNIDDLDSVVGGASGRVEKPVEWPKWPKCDDAFSSKCPGEPPCALFGTPDCIQGHYNPDYTSK